MAQEQGLCSGKAGQGGNNYWKPLFISQEVWEKEIAGGGVISFFMLFNFIGSEGGVEAKLCHLFAAMEAPGKSFA